MTVIGACKVAHVIERWLGDGNYDRFCGTVAVMTSCALRECELCLRIPHCYFGGFPKAQAVYRNKGVAQGIRTRHELILYCRCIDVETAPIFAEHLD
jgi:hypothetical protein